MKACVIGGGPAGYVSALVLRRSGAEVFLIEKEELGGTCLNKGCIPTKTLIHSLKNSSFSTDLQTLMDKKR